MADQFDEATRQPHRDAQKELANFVQTEQAQAHLTSQIHMLTSMCWDKCITSSPSTRFARGEESCLANCVERFLDTSLHMVKQIQEERDRSQLSR
ncbi:hypothetical protein DAEQUDRAFT_760792 [Daedalea quercina L-15889]|uniref:Mitochondrial import inner membrane translocase subunit n=1 Tax=Daedalea quercina L-15889 TaxID=1314783 RepID=A0A165UE32_9APHY|nr:hypothetical protein DAEQUDRAFT_760792 [Daedalea quercina L-15889]